MDRFLIYLLLLCINKNEMILLYIISIYYYIFCLINALHLVVNGANLTTEVPSAFMFMGVVYL